LFPKFSIWEALHTSVLYLQGISVIHPLLLHRHHQMSV
jgi:hypothetical protein